MTGLAVYFLFALGLGGWLPSLVLGGRRSLGAALFGGYGAMLAALFVLQALAGAGPGAAFRIVAALALGGLLRLAWRERGAAGNAISHPALLLPAGAAVLIGVQGGIDYLPYVVDEFTNWIGAAKDIHLAGGYAAARDGVYLPAYTPGWRLALLLPWQIDGAFVPGRSAAAAFVLHAGLVALLYDIVRAEAADRLDLNSPRSALAAWLIVLVYLAAQGTGTLWAYVLLIEQPQIYAYAGVGFLLFAVRPGSPAPPGLYLHIGLAVLAGYLLKSATLALLPGLALAVLLVRRRPAAAAHSQTASWMRDGAWLFGPVLVAAAAWSLSLPDTARGCLASPLATLTPEALADAMARDRGDLAARFLSAVGGYVWGYKTPVLIAAAAGLILACLRKRPAAFVALGVFAAVYMALLYWYHLSCFGDYYFARLNSIERFTRVVLQPLHALGLMALAVAALDMSGKNRAGSWFELKPVLGGLTAAILGLAALQAIEVSRTLDDITTRRHQSVDPRIAEVRAAAAFAGRHFADSAAPPLIQFVAQGTDSDILGYAKYHAADGARGRPRTLFRPAGEVSWSQGAPANHWQQRRGEADLLATWQQADILWPIVTNPWTDGLLRGLAATPADCAGPTTGYAFVKRPDGRFACRPKP